MDRPPFRHCMRGCTRHYSALNKMTIRLLSAAVVEELYEDMHIADVDHQASHTAPTASIIYVLDIQHMFSSSFTTPGQHLRVSQEWHRLITSLSRPACPNRCRKCGYIREAHGDTTWSCRLRSRAADQFWDGQDVASQAAGGSYGHRRAECRGVVHRRYCRRHQRQCPG